MLLQAIALILIIVFLSLSKFRFVFPFSWNPKQILIEGAISLQNCIYWLKGIQGKDNHDFKRKRNEFIFGSLPSVIWELVRFVFALPLSKIQYKFHIANSFFSPLKEKYYFFICNTCLYPVIVYLSTWYLAEICSIVVYKFWA